MFAETPQAKRETFHGHPDHRATFVLPYHELNLTDKVIVSL